MANNAWSDFYDWVLPYVPGCTQPVADDAIREAVIEWCEQTLILTRTITISSAANVPTYDMAGPLAAQYPSDGSQLQVFAVLDGWYNGTRIFRQTDEELADRFGPDWDASSNTGTPAYFNMKDENFLRLYRTPNATGASNVLIKVALEPTATAGVIDGLVLSGYRQDIALGALAALMMSPKKPYTNMALGQEKATEFHIACTQSQTNKLNNYTRKPLRSKPDYR